MGRRSREARAKEAARRPARRARRAVALAAAAALIALGAGWALRGRREGGEPAGDRATAAGAPIIDPRAMRFPRDLSPESRGKLDRAIEAHLAALDAFSRKAAGEGSARA